MILWTIVNSNFQSSLKPKELSLIHVVGPLLMIKLYLALEMIPFLLYLTTNRIKR